MSRVILKRGNDQVVTLLGLRTTAKPPVYLNAATVKATLRDSREQPFPQFTAVPMPYVAGSNGNYEWSIESELMMLPKGVDYSLEFTAVQDGLNYRVVHSVSIEDG